VAGTVLADWSVGVGIIRTIIEQFDRGFVNGPLASPLVPRPIRKYVLRALGYNVHSTACIAERCYIGSRRVSFEADSFANVGCYFDGNADIRVGAGVQIGMWSMFATATHEISDRASRRAGRDLGRPIRVGSGSWIGARSTVLPGVDIGQGCVIGAGSLVIRTCDPNWVYLGAPARKSRSLTEEDPSPASNSMTSAETRIIDKIELTRSP
jgi:maltose O-acetyltransferase